MITDYPERRFQLWEYRVSHGSLLIRSPRGVGFSQNVDFVFVGVEYLAVPRVFRGLALVARNRRDRMDVTAAIGSFESERLHVLASAGRQALPGAQ